MNEYTRFVVSLSTSILAPAETNKLLTKTDFFVKTVQQRNHGFSKRLLQLIG